MGKAIRSERARKLFRDKKASREVIRRLADGETGFVVELSDGTRYLIGDAVADIKPDGGIAPESQANECDGKNCKWKKAYRRLTGLVVKMKTAKRNGYVYIHDSLLSRIYDEVRNGPSNK